MRAYLARPSAGALLLVILILVALALAPAALAAGATSAQGDGSQAAAQQAPSSLPADAAATQAKYAKSDVIGASGKVLIVQDAPPWGYTANETAAGFFRAGYDLIGSNLLGTVSLTPYKAVIFASVGTSMTGAQIIAHDANLAANVEKVEAYVYAGGKLIAHMAPLSSSTWITKHTLPCNIHAVFAPQEDLVIGVSSDAFISGLPNGVATLAEGSFDSWFNSTHGYFTDLPFNAKKVLTIQSGPDTGDATYVAYPFGKGTVRACVMPMEWSFANGPAGQPGIGQQNPAALLNEFGSVLPRPVFKVSSNAWRFRSGGDTAAADDVTAWTNVFGSSPASLTAQSAQTTAATAAGRSSFFAGGQSFGLAATAGAYFPNYRTFTDAGIAGKTTPWSWGTWGTSNIFDGRRTAGTSTQLRIEVQKYQVAFHNQATFTEWAGNRLSRSNKSLGRTWTSSYASALALFAKDLKQKLRWGPQVLVLTKGRVSHALLAYKATSSGSGSSAKTVLSCYDPNYPGVVRSVTLQTGTGAWTYTFAWRKGSTNASFTMKSATSGDAISWVSPATVTRAVRGIYTGIAPDLVNAPDM